MFQTDRISTSLSGARSPVLSFLLFARKQPPGSISQQNPLLQHFASAVGIQVVPLPFHEIGGKGIYGSGSATGKHNLRDSALIDGSVRSHDFFGRQLRVFPDSRCFRS
jgi:hypothetical protein